MGQLIQNGYILNPADQTEGMLDLLIEDDRICSIGRDLADKAEVDQIIDAKGKYVMPGFIDLHVHLREPGFEAKETIQTGAMAAAAGGYTTICSMPNTNPVIDSKERVQYVTEKAAAADLVHILPIGAVTKSQLGKELSDIKGMKEAGICALSEDGKSVMNSLLYKKGLEEAVIFNLPIFAHCEDKDLVNGGVMNAGKIADMLGLPGITNAVEDVITARDIFLAKETGARLHLCHCSTRDSIELIRLGKRLGVQVSAEACPHHFSLCEEDILEDDGNYKMNPPLRSREDMAAVRQALADGVIEVIATDHAPHCAEEKNQSMKNAPFGIVGLETAFSLTMTYLVKTGILTPMQLAERMSYTPAKILGIPKGSLAVGSVADIVIADQNKEYLIDENKFCSKGKNTPFKGHKVTGKIWMTICSGKIIYKSEDNKND